MKPFIERSEWLFVVVKGLTLLLAFLVFRAYWKTHGRFIEKICWIGSACYITIWTVWFLAASISA